MNKNNQDWIYCQFGKKICDFNVVVDMEFPSWAIFFIYAPPKYSIHTPSFSVN